MPSALSCSHEGAWARAGDDVPARPVQKVAEGCGEEPRRTTSHGATFLPPATLRSLILYANTLQQGQLFTSFWAAAISGDSRRPELVLFGKGSHLRRAPTVARARLTKPCLSLMQPAAGRRRVFKCFSPVLPKTINGGFS